MSLECGIVGLPNVGKSTLFNTLTSAQVAAENFPFCTVDPNRGVVDVPDPRMKQLAELVKPQKLVQANVTFVDIAGLVKGASQGEGLGNQFLSHIRSVDAIVHVVRCFEDPNIIHVMGGVDPARDVEIIDLELCLADLDRVRARIDKIARLSKSGNAEARAEMELLEKAASALEKGEPLRRHLSSLKDLSDLSQFLTAKPLMYMANIAESEIRQMSERTQSWIEKLREIAKKDAAPVVVLSVALEYQLSQLPDEDRGPFLEEYGIQEPGLHRFIREAYGLLGLITYFTAGEKEVRAWTITRGQTAVDAAGKIHSDFARGFIRAEVIHFEDYLRCKGEKLAREQGLQRAEGRDYVVLDGDVILFRFNV
jgi:GTP-binding protein YchF